MKSSAQAQSRDSLRDRQKRTRAAAPTLRSRYPGVATLQLQFQFKDDAPFLPSPQVTVYHPPAQAYFAFACPYGDCSGEFDLTAAVDSMLTSGESRAEGQLPCGGTRPGGTTCNLRLEYTVVAQRG